MSRYKHKHNLICRKASFHKNVTEKTFACVLVIGCHSERGEELAYCNDDFVGNNILCLTAVNSDNMMTARLIHTRNDFALFVRIKSRLNLVAVVVGSFHSDNFFNGAKAFEKFFYFLLLEFKLFGI